MKRWLLLLALLLCAPARADIVLVYISDDQSDELFNDARTETPNLDSMRTAGFSATNAMTGAVCSPSRAALLGMRNHLQQGITKIVDYDSWPTQPAVHLDPGDARLFQRIKSAGWKVVYEGKLHVGRIHADASLPGGSWLKIAGVDRSTVFTPGGVDVGPGGLPTQPDGDCPTSHHGCWVGCDLDGTCQTYEDPDLATNKYVADAYWSTNVVTDAALADITWCDVNGYDCVIFVAVHAPHIPFEPGPSCALADVNSGTSCATYDYCGVDGSGDLRTEACFHWAVEANDTLFGEIRDALDDLGGGLDPATGDHVLIYTSDNGTPQAVDDSVNGNCDDARVKGSLYTCGWNVPMVIEGRGVTSTNSTAAAPIAFADLGATILEIIGAPVTDTHDAKSFWGCVSSPGDSCSGRDVAVTFSGNPNADPSPAADWLAYRAAAVTQCAHSPNDFYALRLDFTARGGGLPWDMNYYYNDPDDGCEVSWQTGNEDCIVELFNITDNRWNSIAGSWPDGEARYSPGGTNADMTADELTCYRKLESAIKDAQDRGGIVVQTGTVSSGVTFGVE